MPPILEAKNINKSFREAITVQVLFDISFSIEKGEFVSIIGKSGCGKSTLLYILSTMDTDYTGELLIDNMPMHNRKEKELASIRNEKIGFVFQFHYLLNEFTVLKNIMLPALKLNKYTQNEIAQRALLKLKMLGIEHLADKKPNRLSGGEKQRVAIARSIINDPSIIMCDEPTGNLDNKSSQMVFDIFQQLSVEFHHTLLVVTHDMGFAHNTQRVIEMEDGKIVKL
jgi:lipoprotein-releasing system ATP-binding protein